MYAVHVRYVTYYRLSFSKAATAIYPRDCEKRARQSQRVIQVSRKKADIKSGVYAARRMFHDHIPNELTPDEIKAGRGPLYVTRVDARSCQ